MVFINILLDTFFFGGSRTEFYILFFAIKNLHVNDIYFQISVSEMGRILEIIK
jgi:hypothetical protein